MSLTNLTTSVCLCTYIPNEKRLVDLTKVLQSLELRVVSPAEVVIVDDKSPLAEDTMRVLNQFKESMSKSHPNIPVLIHVNETNLKHARSQNKSWELAKGDVLIHIEDDITVEFTGWNQVFAKCIQDHPEVGQVLPRGSGRGENIPRPEYNEYSWGLGGLFAVKREVFEKIGGWDPTLVHQIEPDYNIRVRMAGWRVGQIEPFAMNHLGEGDFAETFERQAQVHIGVYNFLKKWNRRFFGTYAYSDVWCMSPDDFPINVAFRRQVAAFFVSQAYDYDKALKNEELNLSDNTKKQVTVFRDDMMKCRLNENPKPFKYPGHWGQYELVQLIRPPGRERENELIEKMGVNFVFRDVPQLHANIKNLADRMNTNMTDEDVAKYLQGKEWEYDWEAKTACLGVTQ